MSGVVDWLLAFAMVTFVTVTIASAVFGLGYEALAFGVLAALCVYGYIARAPKRRAPEAKA